VITPSGIRAVSIEALPVPDVVVFRSRVALILARADAAMDAVSGLDRISFEARLDLLDWWFWLAAHQVAREYAGPARALPTLMPKIRGEWL